MITDLKLYFSDGQEVTDSAASESVLNFASIAEVGRGSQLYINVFTDGGFTSDPDVMSIRLKTGSTSPGRDVVLEVATDVTIAALSVAHRICKVPLPSLDMLQYASLYYYALSSMTSGGKLTAFLTLN